MTTITEDYVSFETAKLLKEKGFDEECCTWYGSDGNIHKTGYEMRNSDCTLNSMMAPTLQMTMKWLRNVHRLFIHIDVIREASCWLADIQDIKDDVSIYPVKVDFPNYEEACEGAIKYCIKNLI